METKKEKYRYLLNMPSRLALQVKQQAKNEERSMAKYILIAVQEKVDREKNSGK